MKFLWISASRRMDLVEGFRIACVLPLVRGKVLDVGCGFNNLVRHYSGVGWGVDVYPWPGVDAIVDSTRLPFRDHSFDTVTMIACLNHIQEREGVLSEVQRVLCPTGKLLLTMIGPTVGRLAHMLFRQDERERGGGATGEYRGLKRGCVERLVGAAGFRISSSIRFELGLNRLYVAAKREDTTTW